MTPTDFSAALAALIASARANGMSLDEVQAEMEIAIDELEEDDEETEVD